MASLEDHAITYLVELMEQSHGNVTQAAERAGIERQSVHRLLAKHGLKSRDFRPRGGSSRIAMRALRRLRAGSKRVSSPTQPL